MKSLIIDNDNVNNDDNNSDDNDSDDNNDNHNKLYDNPLTGLKSHIKCFMKHLPCFWCHR